MQQQQLQPSETSLVIKAKTEGLDPQQVLCRDLLVSSGTHCLNEATAYVKQVGPLASANLKLLLEISVDKAKAYHDFNAAFWSS